jgi:hypothetical protein
MSVISNEAILTDESLSFATINVLDQGICTLCVLSKLVTVRFTNDFMKNMRLEFRSQKWRNFIEELQNVCYRLKVENQARLSLSHLSSRYEFHFLHIYLLVPLLYS